MRRAREILRNFDPPGIGSEDIRECLLFQLELRGESDTPAYEMIDQWMDLLLRRRIPELSRKLGISKDEVQDAIEHIAELDPHPGNRFREDTNSTISPDAGIEWDGNKWVININSDYIPRLRINPTYKQMIAKGTLTKKEKEYIQEKLRSAQWLIRSIFQRQRTIFKVTESIVKQQRAFFEQGLAGLRPMILRDVAEDIEMHESTVSRVTTNKYVHTPHGIFPLKFFFNSGIQRNDGEDVASEMVKQRIKAMIGDENPQKPYSDQKIVQMLKEEKITIARRTVAKYRDMLSIPSSSQRKRLF